MVRDTRSYLILHYVVLLALIFLVVGVLEGFVAAVPLWVGVLIAIFIGLVYPRVVVRMGYGPERWEA